MKKRLKIYLRPEDYEMLKKVAYSKSMSMNEYVKQLIYEELAR